MDFEGLLCPLIGRSELFVMVNLNVRFRALGSTTQQRI
jgi:hypothetical protein